MSLAGEQTYNGHQTLVVRLVQRVRGMIDHEDVLVEPKGWTIEKMTYYYYNGGTIALRRLSQRRRFPRPLRPARDDLVAAYPSPRSGRRTTRAITNVAIDDSVFTERETKEMGTR